MNPHAQRLVERLGRGVVSAHRGRGNSMLPRIRSGQRQILVPVLDDARGLAAGATQLAPGEQPAEGDLRFLPPEDLRPGDVVYCKVGPNAFTHEVVAVRPGRGGPEFLIAPHHRRHVNGWTRSVYAKCVRVED